MALVGNANRDCEHGIRVTDQHLLPINASDYFYCTQFCTEQTFRDLSRDFLPHETLSLTCANFPPVDCHTFNDISREPVITCSESAVMTKHVISSVCETWYFSSSRVSDHILRLLSPFVLIYKWDGILMHEIGHKHTAVSAEKIQK
jgi:hypothetical protein